MDLVANILGVGDAVIVLHSKKIAIMTPPKCGTNTLHAALRVHPWFAESYCGPSPAAVGIADGGCDRHMNSWPGEVKRFPTKLIVIRKPETRLVSIYLHLCSRNSGTGRAAPSFAEYVSRVAENKERRPLYSWNLTRWLEGVEFDGILRVESLQQDLAAHGIELKDLPSVNVSYKGQPYKSFYTPELTTQIEPWMSPDRQRWYQEGESVTASATGG